MVSTIIENIESNDTNIITTIIKPKRGRRSKKDIALALALTLSNATNSISPSFLNQENTNPNSIDDIVVSSVQLNDKNTKKINKLLNKSIKIKKDKKVDQNKLITLSDNENINNEIDINDESVIVKPPAKKRGRKPKGGKIIIQSQSTILQQEIKPNIILHLKCSIKDLQNSSEYNSTFNNKNIESFDFTNSKNELAYEVINTVEKKINNTLSFNHNNNCDNQVHSQLHNHVTNQFHTSDNTIQSLPNTNNNNKLSNVSYNQQEYVYNVNELNIEYNTTTNNTNSNNAQYIEYDNEDSRETKVLWNKLKILEHNLHINNVSDKKSACFWCSYDFDNPPIYIPKFYLKDSYHVYGCFCSPECATAHLMEENIDSSIKFERYYLINHIYSKLYEYKKNIKPAPNPYYMLEKYYGNLTIQEYRNLLRSERLFLIVDKPLTRILPEFHEDNDEFIINNKIIPSNNYQVKKRLQKKPQHKNNNVTEKFGSGSG